MRMFKLAISNVVDCPVKFKVQDGSDTKTHAFTLIGKRITQQELRDAHADDTTSVRDYLKAQITGWRGQRLVVDGDSGEPAAFSVEAFECLLTLPGMEAVAYRAYLAANVLADTAEGRAGK